MIPLTLNYDSLVRIAYLRGYLERSGTEDREDISQKSRSGLKKGDVDLENTYSPHPSPLVSRKDEG